MRQLMRLLEPRRANRKMPVELSATTELNKFPIDR